MLQFSHLLNSPEFLNNLSGVRLRYLSHDEKLAEGFRSRNEVPIHERFLLNMKEAAELLSMSEQALRDLVHKGQGPVSVKRGKRVCFTREGLSSYVDSLPKERPYQDVVKVINSTASKPPTTEERRVFRIS